MGMVLAYSSSPLEAQIFQADPYSLGKCPLHHKISHLPFCVTPAANSTQLQAGPDYKCPGVWGWHLGV